MTRTAFALLLLLASLPSAAFSAEPAAGIPFRLENGLIWVQVTAGRGHKKLDFMVDSGAGSTVLSLDAMRRLRLKPGDPVPVHGVGMHGVAYRLHDFEAALDGIPLKKEIFAVALRGRSGKRRLDGLLGQDFFRGRIVRIDFKARRLELLEKAERGGGTVAVVPLRYQKDAMCIPVGVNGLPPEWARLDTGCVSPLEWASNVGAPKRDSFLRPASSGGELSRRGAVSLEVQLGSERVRGVEVGVHPQPFFPGEAGLVGLGLLSRYRVTIDAREMRVLLEKP